MGATDILWNTGAIGDKTLVKDIGPEGLPSVFDEIDLFDDDTAFELISHTGQFMLNLDPGDRRGFYHGQDWYL